MSSKKSDIEIIQSNFMMIFDELEANIIETRLAKSIEYLFPMIKIGSSLAIIGNKFDSLALKIHKCTK